MFNHVKLYKHDELNISELTCDTPYSDVLNKIRKSPFRRKTTLNLLKKKKESH